jgi:hypothetical protein
MQVMVRHDRVFLVRLAVALLVIAGQKARSAVFAPVDPAIHHFSNNAVVKMDGYAGQARV